MTMSPAARQMFATAMPWLLLASLWLCGAIPSRMRRRPPLAAARPDLGITIVAGTEFVGECRWLADLFASAGVVQFDGCEFTRVRFPNDVVPTATFIGCAFRDCVFAAGAPWATVNCEFESCLFAGSATRDAFGYPPIPLESTP